MGELVVDLRDVDLPAGTTEDASSTWASATPSCACPRMRACPPTCRSARATRRCSAARSDGLDVDFAQAAAPTGDAPRLVLDGDLGIGALEVVRGDDPLPSDRDGWWDDNVRRTGPACP